MSERDEDGTKKRHTDEDRTREYFDWHLTLGSKMWMLDVDSIEWRAGAYGPKPVAVIEVTRVDREEIDDTYFQAIVDRYNKKDLQGQATRHVATALGVQPYLCVFRKDLSEFWVHNLSTGKTWVKFSQQEYGDWVINLPLPQLPNYDDDYDWDF